MLIIEIKICRSRMVQNYLSVLKQRVVLPGGASDRVKINAGVSQGSIF